MATARVGGAFTLVFLVFNGISNVLSQDAQIAMFQNAARHLEPGGRFVIELWIPDLRRLPPGAPGSLFAAQRGYVAFDVHDPVAQRVVSHHVTFDGDDGHRAGVIGTQSLHRLMVRIGTPRSDSCQQATSHACPTRVAGGQGSGWRGAGTGSTVGVADVSEAPSQARVPVGEIVLERGAVDLDTRVAEHVGELS